MDEEYILSADDRARNEFTRKASKRLAGQMYYLWNKYKEKIDLGELNVTLKVDESDESDDPNRMITRLGYHPGGIHLAVKLQGDVFDNTKHHYKSISEGGYSKTLYKNGIIRPIERDVLVRDINWDIDFSRELGDSFLTDYLIARKPGLIFSSNRKKLRASRNLIKKLDRQLRNEGERVFSLTTH
ncbi:MAG: hypothetical protein CL811_12785 [Colwelliaceae bacterium]|nr:hypothetical protein [Colwelliaceae bacterium]|tara:strand:+ start:442 stop:996 length:555 start_codon:yes stop_codon:yes gene_type:complete